MGYTAHNWRHLHLVIASLCLATAISLPAASAAQLTKLQGRAETTRITRPGIGGSTAAKKPVGSVESPILDPSKLKTGASVSVPFLELETTTNDAGGSGTLNPEFPAAEPVVKGNAARAAWPLHASTEADRATHVYLGSIRYGGAMPIKNMSSTENWNRFNLECLGNGAMHSAWMQWYKNAELECNKYSTDGHGPARVLVCIAADGSVKNAMLLGRSDDVLDYDASKLAFFHDFVEQVAAKGAFKFPDGSQVKENDFLFDFRCFGG